MAVASRWSVGTSTIVRPPSWVWYGRPGQIGCRFCENAGWVLLPVRRLSHRTISGRGCNGGGFLGCRGPRRHQRGGGLRHLPAGQHRRCRGRRADLRRLKNGRSAAIHRVVSDPTDGATDVQSGRISAGSPGGDGGEDEHPGGVADLRAAQCPGAQDAGLLAPPGDRRPATASEPFDKLGGPFTGVIDRTLEKDLRLRWYRVSNEWARAAAVSAGRPRPCAHEFMGRPVMVWVSTWSLGKQPAKLPALAVSFFLFPSSCGTAAGASGLRRRRPAFILLRPSVPVPPQAP